MNQSVSWGSHRVHLYFLLNLCSDMAVIVSSEDVDNCVCVSLRVNTVCTLKNATVCSVCSCLTCLAPRSKKMNNLLSRFQPGWAVWNSFLAQTYQSNFLPLLPLSILPSLPLLHTLSFEVNIFAGHLTWSVINLNSLNLRPGLGKSLSWFVFLPFSNVMVYF